MYEYKAMVMGHDGIRAHLVVDLGLNETKEVKLPYHGIRIVNTSAARRMLEQDIPAGTTIVLTAHPIGNGEWTATVYHEGQTMNVNDMLVSEGHAVDLSSGSPAGKSDK